MENSNKLPRKNTYLLIVKILLWVLLQVIYCVIVPAIFSLFSSFGFLFFTITGLYLLGISVICLIKEKHKLISLISILLILFISIATLKTSVIKYFALGHLWVYQSYYESKIDHILLEKDPKKQKSLCFFDCSIRELQPLKVEFHYMIGIVIGYNIVYDPSGKVNSSNPIERKGVNLYIVETEHLMGDWYLCALSD